MKKIGIALMVSAFVLGGAVMSHAAETVHLYLKSAKIKSFNPEVPSGIIQGLRRNETLAGEIKFITSRSGKRTYEPLVIRKRIDKSSPLLARAMKQKMPLMGEMFEYKTLANGDVSVSRKATFQGLTINKIEKAPMSAKDPGLEEVSFVFHNIIWTEINKKFPKDQWKTGYPSN